MAAVNKAAEFDDIATPRDDDSPPLRSTATTRTSQQRHLNSDQQLQLNLESSSSTINVDIPRIYISEADDGDDGDEDVRAVGRPKKKKPGASRPSSATIDKVPSTPVGADPTVVVISPRPDGQLERQMVRRVFGGFIGCASAVGGTLEKVGMADAGRKTVSHALALSVGAIHFWRVPGVTFASKTVGPSSKQFSIGVYSPEQQPRNNNSSLENNNKANNNTSETGETARRQSVVSSKQPVVVYIRGFIPYSSARAYHSFLANLCRDIDAIVLSYDYRAEHSFVATLDDCVAFMVALMTGDLDADLEPLDVDYEKIVLAGDDAGATMACATAIELARRSNFDLPNLHGLALICPPLQALSTNLFSSHQRFAQVNNKMLSHRLDLRLPLYALIKGRANVHSAKVAIRSEKHVPNELKTRLIRRIYPQYDGSQSSTSVGTESANNNNDMPVELIQLATNPKIWPLLMKNKELALLPMTMMQICDHDTLYDEQRMLAKRLSKVCGYRFRLSVVENATHNETVFYRILKTKASQTGYRDVVEFLKDTIAKPPVHDSVPSSSAPPVDALPESIE